MRRNNTSKSCVSVEYLRVPTLKCRLKLLPAKLLAHIEEPRSNVLQISKLAADGTGNGVHSILHL